MTNVAVRYAPIAMLIVLWETLSRTGAVAPDVLPAFSTVMERLWELTASGDMVRHVVDSL